MKILKTTLWIHRETGLMRKRVKTDNVQYVKVIDTSNSDQVMRSRITKA
jgi:hypothetical protein